ncbi:MAG: DUF3261 domain-containing protein, partial [Methylococcales bacterium]|nr:DUF3261 domain-containing protein [Methylococcales bacterium]
QFDAKYLLADVQLVHWPIQALQSALAPSNVLVQQQGLHRVVVAKGKNIIEMDLQGEGPWYDHVEYRHLQRGYALFIDTLSVSPL